MTGPYRFLYHHRIRAEDGQAVHVREMIGALRQAGHEVREGLNQRVREFGDRMGWSDRRAGDDEAAAH